jgi:glutaredoxin
MNQFGSSDRYTVYTRKFCIYCDRVKELLDSHKKVVNVIECDSMIQHNRASFLEMIDSLTVPRVHRTFPYVFIGDVFIGGFDDTQRYIEEQGLGYSFNDDNF